METLVKFLDADEQICVEYEKSKLITKLKQEVFFFVENVLSKHDEEDEAEDVFEIVWSTFISYVLQTLNELSKKAIKQNRLTDTIRLEVEYFEEIESENGKPEKDKLVILFGKDTLRQIINATVKQLSQQGNFKNLKEVKRELVKLYKQNVDLVVESIENVKRVGNKFIEKLLKKTKALGEFLVESAISEVKNGLFYDAGVFTLDVTDVFIGPLEERLERIMKIYFRATGLEDLYEPTSDEKQFPLVRKFIESSQEYKPELVGYDSGLGVTGGFVGKRNVLRVLNEFRKDKYELEVKFVKGTKLIEEIRFIEKKELNSLPHVTYVSYQVSHLKDNETYTRQAIELSKNELSFYSTVLQSNLSFTYEKDKLPVFRINDDYFPLPQDVARAWLNLIGNSFEEYLKNVEDAQNVNQALTIIKKLEQTKLKDAMQNYANFISNQQHLFALFGSVYHQLNHLENVNQWKPVKRIIKHRPNELQYEVDVSNDQIFLKVRDTFHANQNATWIITLHDVTCQGTLWNTIKQSVNDFLNLNHNGFIKELLEHLQKLNRD